MGDPPYEASQPTALPNVSRRRVAIVNTLFAYVGVAFTLVQGVLLVPLYVRHVPMALYGAWLATGNVLAWLELVDPGIAVVLQQRVAVAYGGNRSDDMAKIIGTSMCIAVGLSSLPLLAMPFAHHLGPLMHLTGNDAAVLAKCFRIGLVSTSVSLAAFALHAISTGLQLTFFTGLVAVSSSLIGVCVTFVMLLRGAGLISLPLGLLVRSSLLLLGNAVQIAVWTRRWLPVRPHFARREARAFGGLLGLTFQLRLGTVLLERMEAFLSARLVSPDAAARLVLTGRSSEVVRMVASRVPPALVPSLSHLVGEGKHDRVAEIFGVLGRYQGWFTAIGVASVIALNEWFVTLWLGPSFFGGQALTVLQAIAAALWLMTGAMYQVFIASGAIRAVSLLALAEAVVRLPLQLVLIRWLGLIGLPLATCLSTGVVSGGYLVWLATRTYDSEHARPSREWVRGLGWIAVMSGVGVILHLAMRAAPLRKSWPMFATLSVLTAVFLVALLIALDHRARAAAAAGISYLRRRRRQQLTNE